MKTNNFELKKDQIYKLLKSDIMGGKYAYGLKLPSETEFAKELNVGKVTLRSALEQLESESFIARIHGKGTFVSYEKNKPGNQDRILVIQDLMDACGNPSSYILQGIHEAAYKAGFSVLTHERHYLENLSPVEFRKILENNNILGIIPILSLFLGHEKILKILQKSGLPTVLPNAEVSDNKITGFATIVVDKQSGWKKAVSHLVEKGHARIGIIIPRTAPHIRGYTLDEFKTLLAKTGAKADDGLIKFVDYEKESAKSAVKELMKLPLPPTAILCYSDFLAVYAYDALKELSLSIPEDVSVMGCCGYPGAAILIPPLSTIDYQYSYLGQSVVDLILKHHVWFNAKRKVALPQIYISPELRERGSTDIRRVEKVFRQ